jgi:hypothetical protein
LGFGDDELSKLLGGMKLDDGIADSELLPEQWGVQVDCINEMNQVEVMEYLEAGGFQCRALIS